MYWDVEPSEIDRELAECIKWIKSLRDGDDQFIDELIEIVRELIPDSDEMPTENSDLFETRMERIVDESECIKTEDNGRIHFPFDPKCLEFQFPSIKNTGSAKLTSEVIIFEELLKAAEDICKCEPTSIESVFNWRDPDVPETKKKQSEDRINLLNILNITQKESNKNADRLLNQVFSFAPHRVKCETKVKNYYSFKEGLEDKMMNFKLPLDTDDDIDYFDIGKVPIPELQTSFINRLRSAYLSWMDRVEECPPGNAFKRLIWDKIDMLEGYFKPGVYFSGEPDELERLEKDKDNYEMFDITSKYMTDNVILKRSQTKML